MLLTELTNYQQLVRQMIFASIKKEVADNGQFSGLLLQRPFAMECRGQTREYKGVIVLGNTIYAMQNPQFDSATNQWNYGSTNYAIEFSEQGGGSSQSNDSLLALLRNIRISLFPNTPASQR